MHPRSTTAKHIHPQTPVAPPVPPPRQPPPPPPSPPPSLPPDSDIFLDDATVSRRHVEFRLENGQFLLVDLDSLNNTYVNHEPVDSAVLVNGDEIQIGKFRLVFLTRPTTAETRTFRWIGACAHPDDAVKSCSAGWPNRPHDR